MSKQCQHCKQMNADWARECGRCGRSLFQALDLDDAFEDYMRRVQPTTPQHALQYKESRRVWFAAASVVFDHISLEITQLSDEDAFKQLQLLGAQFEAFIKRVKEHRD